MASASSGMHSIPFRRSTHLDFSKVIRQYIDDKYDQHPDMFRPDLETIDALRKAAVNVREPHSAGVKKLQAYAGQLAWIGGKFPIDIGADFAWYPALGANTERPLVRNNLKYELMNILYNLAALYSQLAIETPRDNTEGLKSAANYFSLAAGVLSHVQKNVLPELRMSDPPEDMDANTLESLIQLCLAESQECFWSKAVMDGYKDMSIAKLAARVSDLYNLAAEAAVSSEAISSAWIRHMKAKSNHYAAAAQFRASRECLEKRKYGEEVARLMEALACVNEGIKETRGGVLSKIVVDNLQGLKKMLEGELKRAEKDNDVLYLNVVPPKAELKILERANLAVPRVPAQVSNPYDSLGEGAEFGPALFSKLVPFSVHVAISIYEERRDRMVNKTIIQELEALNENIHSLLSSVGLPGSLQALEKPLGLPPNLVQHAEEIRQADAVNRIQKSFADIDKMRSADLDIFGEGKEMLGVEAAEDERMLRKYGTDRWTMPRSQEDPQGAKLWTLAGEIEGYFESSINSDGLVQEKFAANEDLLRILAGSDRMLMNYVPASTPLESSQDLKGSVGRLRSAYNDVLRLESRRRKKVENLRDIARRDDIKPDILKEAARLERSYPSTAIVPAHFEDFFEKRLDKLYEPELDAVEKEAKEQEKILAQIERANREFESQKRIAGDRGPREREAALQRLNGAYYKYKEILSNLEVGRKFYNDLNKIVSQGFRDAVKAWVAQRRLDARALEEELSMPTLSRLSIGHPREASPPVSGYQHEQQQRQQQSLFTHAPLQHQMPPEPVQHQYMQQQPAARQEPAQRQYIQEPVQRQYVQQQQQQIPQQMPPHQTIHDAEASIQSWASPAPPAPQVPVQPQAQPMPAPGAMGGTWNPSMGIRFGGPPPAPGGQGGQGQGQGQGQARGGPAATWNQGSGIRFG